MRHRADNLGTGGGLRAPLVLVLAAVLFDLGAGIGRASPPIEPIPVPLYSFDLASPTVAQGAVFADAVLQKGDATEMFPVTVFSGEDIGLGIPGDDLDGLSFDRSASIGPTQTFLLLFSVDRATTGDVPPDESLHDAGVAFNVADQAMRGQAAGDAFVSLALYTQSGMVQPPPLRALPQLSNVQTLNNYDEGGHDFQAQPATSSLTYVSGDPQDNVDALAAEPVSTSGLRVAPGLYFTVTGQSPSLFTPGRLPGNSGADIFHDPAPADPVSLVERYASQFDLGLFPQMGVNNEISAMVIFDNNGNGAFDFGDVVLFSLAAGSPALMVIPEASDNPTADVFATHVGTDGLPHVSVFARATDLGLNGSTDAIDALDAVPCSTNALACAEAAGIRFVPGDWNNDGAVGDADLPGLVGCVSGPIQGQDFVPPPPICLDVFDFRRDGDVDLFDFGGFQSVFGQSVFGPVPP